MKGTENIQQDITANNKRIAKNTLMLYIRMFLMMGISLFTSRIILQTLGVEDFGIYNVVAGIVVLFTFINTAMSIASQRFLSFALGKNDDDEVKRVFSMSLTSHIVIAGIILLLAESVGLWMLSELNMPADRVLASTWVYQLAVFTCVVNVIRVPYNAIITAYERMSFYAWISIIEAVLKLLIVYLLVIYAGDRLILYSFLLLVVTIIINIVYKVFCNKTFSTSRYQFYWNPALFKQFVSFSGWSLAGSLANVGAQQGLNMIINLFCGVLVNAAVGISNQVMSAVGQFLMNFQTAFNPQLVKSYATGDRKYFMDLIFNSSKVSYYLMYLVSLPVIINCPFLLHIWLGEVPQYSVEFSQLVILYLLVDAISCPLWISVQAVGKIRNYQLLMSFLIILNIPLSYFVLVMGYSPIYVFVGRVFINIVTFIVRVIYLRSLIQLPARKYVIQVVLPVMIITLLSAPLPLWVNQMMEEGWSNFISNTLVSLLASVIFIYSIGLTGREREMVKHTIQSKLLKK